MWDHVPFLKYSFQVGTQPIVQDAVIHIMLSRQHTGGMKPSKCTVLSRRKQDPQRAVELTALSGYSLIIKGTVHFYSYQQSSPAV